MKTIEEFVAELESRGLSDLADELTRATGDEVINFKTNVEIELRGADGELKEYREFHNLICTAGKNKLLAVASPDTINSFSYVAIGTGVTAAAIGDTALQTEVARSPLQTATNPTAAQWQVTYLFPAGTGTGAITESGLLDAASAGNLLAHQVFAVINKGASDTLQITWTIS